MINTPEVHADSNPDPSVNTTADAKVDIEPFLGQPVDSSASPSEVIIEDEDIGKTQGGRPIGTGGAAPLPTNVNTAGAGSAQGDGLGKRPEIGNENDTASVVGNRNKKGAKKDQGGYCGDHRVSRALGEECEPHMSQGCNPTSCTCLEGYAATRSGRCEAVPACGNGKLERGEECDSDSEGCLACSCDRENNFHPRHVHNLS